MNKQILVYISVVLAFLICFGCCSWAFIDFIRYVAKDRSFDWWSLVAAFASFVMAFLSAVKMLAFETEIRRDKAKQAPKRVSEFSRRLKEAESEAND